VTVQINHCGRLECIESGGPHQSARCYCACGDCRACACGCAKSGFVRDNETGAWWGMGAGYKLVRLGAGWDVFDEEGKSIYRRDGEPGLYESADPSAVATTLDAANKAATLHAREAGHGHA